MRCAQMVLNKNINHLREFVNTHKKIIQAIKERDLDRCVGLMRKHLEDNHEMIKRNLERDATFQT
jgi:DNA-binding GntR family transcriptional regulator